MDGGLELGLQLVEQELDFTKAVAQDRAAKLYMAAMKLACGEKGDSDILLRVLAKDLLVMQDSFKEVNTTALANLEQKTFQNHLIELGVSGTELADAIHHFGEILQC